MGRRLALLIATYEYQDTGLRRLTTPASDAEALAAVLRDPAIAGFEVTTLINESHHRVGAAIGGFYRDRRRDDLTLLYFTGHGLKDDDGRLYLAMTNTLRDNLLFTGLSAEQVDQAMENCVSRQKILVLDCCYSGAFPAGRIAKADTTVHTLERFQGRGRTVLTASDATQYSFEGDQPHGDAVQSVFTRHLVAGLRDGSADLDGDGDITVDELYSYVHDRVVEEMPQQRPKKQANVEGRTVIARNINWTLPTYLHNAIVSPIAADRLAALDGLAHLHRIGNDIVRDVVQVEIRHLADDDSKVVSAAAMTLQRSIHPQLPELSTTQPDRPPEASERPSPQAPRSATEKTSETQAAPATAPPVPQEPPAALTGMTRRSSDVESPVTGPTVEAAAAASSEPEPVAPPEHSNQDSESSHGRPPLTTEIPPSDPVPARRLGMRLRTRRARAMIVRAAVALLAVVLVVVLSADNGQTGWKPHLISTLDDPKSASIESVAFSPDGKTLATGGSDGARLWDVATGRVTVTLSPDTGTVTTGNNSPSAVRQVAFSPDGGSLAACYGIFGPATAQLWSVATGKLTTTLTEEFDSAFNVAFSPDGKTLATSSESAQLWDVVAGKLIRDLAGSGAGPVAFSQDGTLFTGGGNYGNYHSPAPKLWAATRDQAPALAPRELSGPGAFGSAMFSPDGKTLATSDGDTARLWDVDAGKLIVTLAGHTGYVAGVAFSPDGKTLATGSFDFTVRLWNVATGQPITVLGNSTRFGSSQVAGVAFSPDGKTLAAAGGLSVRIWDVSR